MDSAFSILIPDGESPFALSVLRCLSQIPVIKTFVVSGELFAPIRFSRYSTRFFTRNRDTNEAQRVEVFCEFARRTKADVLLPVGQRAIKLASSYADTLRQSTKVAAVPDPPTFQLAADKWRFAQFLAEHAIGHPATILRSPTPEFEQQLAALRFPVLIKPTHGSYGRGIRHFRTAADLARFFRDASLTEEYIVQSFVNGYDIDCSVLCQDGRILAYTIQKGIVPGYDSFGAPAGIDFVNDDQTFDVASRIVGAMRWSGIAHIDLRFDADEQRVKAIEMNPRYWGSLLGSLVAGVNFPYLACLAALGEDIPKNAYALKRFVAGRAAIRMWTRNLLRGKNAGVGINATSIGFALRDPLPE